MPRLNEIEASDVVRLDQNALTSLLRRLLVCEAQKHGLPLSSVSVAFEVQATDDGEDGRAKWEGGVEKTDWLPNRFTSFQCKATDMGPEKCKEEFLNSAGDDLVPMVKAVLEAGGCYVLFNSRPITEARCQDRVTKIREALTDLGKPYAMTALIQVYSAEKIAEWCNQHLACMTYVAEKAGMLLPIGLKTWEHWSRLEENQSRYVRTPILNAYIGQIQSAIVEHRSVFRIQGLSGLGKTRLVFESFRPDTADTLISRQSAQLIYLDDSTQAQEITSFLSDLCARNKEGIIIVDNCPLRLHKSLASEVRRIDSKLKLISIDYSSEEAEPGIATIQLIPRDLNDVVKDLLQTAFPNLNETDRGRIEHFAQGFPKLAVLLAESRLRNDPTIGRLNDAELLNRLLWAHDHSDLHALRALEACAVFTTLGIIGEADAEFRFVADKICGMSDHEFHSLLHPFRARGICQQAGDYIQITPKPLAIRLAADWWTKYPPGNVATLLSQLSPRLASAMCDQLAYLDFLPVAREVVANLCENHRPFGQAEVLMTKEGSRLFRSIVEVNPSATAKAADRVFGAMEKERLLTLAGAERRNLVNAFEKLCFWEDTFPIAAQLLLQFAAAETEAWQNNASGIFKRLFHIILPGTQAPLSARTRLARNQLLAGDEAKSLIVIAALGHALESRSFWRMGGVEKQGSRPAQLDYNPQRREIADYWREVIDLLGTEAAGSGPKSITAREALTTHMRGLIAQGLFQPVREVILRVVSDGTFWPDAAATLRESLRYEGEKLSEVTRNEIAELIERLAPRTLSEKLKSIVSLPEWESEERDGKFVDIAAENTFTLAAQLVRSGESVLPFLEQIFTGEQRQGFQFGQGLAQNGTSASSFILAALEVMRAIPPEQRTSIVLCGFLSAQSSRVIVSETLDTVANDPTLLGTLVDLTRFSVPTTLDLQRILDLVRQGKIPLEQMRTFAFGSVLGHWPSHDVLWLTNTLREGYGLDGAAIGFHIAYMYCLHDPQRVRDCSSFFAEIAALPGILEKVNNQSLGLGHPWQTTVDALLKGHSDFRLAEKIAEEIVRLCASEKSIIYSDFFIKPILALLFHEYQNIVWPKIGRALLTGDWFCKHNLSDLLGDPHDKSIGAVLIASLPIDLLRSWCSQNGVSAAKELARLTPVIVKHENQVSWHPLAKMLIDDYGSDEEVLRGLTSNIGTYSWEGSAIPYYEQQIHLMQELMDHTQGSVVAWAKSHIEWFEARIARDKKHEDQEAIGIYD